MYVWAEKEGTLSIYCTSQSLLDALVFSFKYKETWSITIILNSLSKLSLLAVIFEQGSVLFPENLCHEGDQLHKNSLLLLITLECWLLTINGANRAEANDKNRLKPSAFILHPHYAIQHHFISESGTLVRLKVLFLFFSVCCSDILWLFVNHTLEFILSFHSLFPLLFSCGNYWFSSL